MQTSVSEIDKNSFNHLATHPLQTWEWGEFRTAAGNEVVRFPFGQMTLHKIPFTKYKVGAFIKGPVPTKEMLDELKQFGKENNLVFIKLEPNFASIDETTHNQLTNLLMTHGAVLGKTLFTPTTFWIDLTTSEEDLMKSFSSKTRYNTRVALRHGVEVVEDNSDKAFAKYLELTAETMHRQQFYAHTRKYHELMWEYLHKQLVANSQQPIARLLTAKYKGEIITTWVLFVWKDFLYYPYGASTDKHKEVMANNLLMWEAIRLGKNLGLSTFDLWGREEGKGFTKFKEGYNPKVVEFLGSWDLVINKPVYGVYKHADRLRWLALRLQAKLGLSKYKF